jgi:riboflavin kinase / FMN adenylyltransferase
MLDGGYPPLQGPPASPTPASPATRFDLADNAPARRFVVAIDPETPPMGLEHPVLAIGNFDGIHRGHKAVIARAKARADALGCPCAAVTFEPHPSDHFGGPGTIFRLTTADDKARLLETLGIDGMVLLTFDKAMAMMPAETFVEDILVRRLGARAVVAGYDFHFGKARTGTPAFLEDAGRRHGFDVEIVPKVESDGDGPIVVASSTATRLALEAGDIARATALLGHPYAITGVVGGGQKLGRTLGFPTANLVADPSCRLQHGIYAVRATVDGTTYDGVASWGRRPTVEVDGLPLLEVFLFDFSGDLYGRTMQVDFVAFLRGEAKFDSLEAMIAQMHADVDDAKAALAADRPA